MIEALEADARKRLDLAGHDGGDESRGLQRGERPLAAEEREDAEDQTAARKKMTNGLRDDTIEQRPAVDAAVVGGGRGVVALAPGRRGHLRGVGGDQVEALARHRRVAIADPRV